MNYKGTIIHIGETETIGAKGFTKRILVAEDQSQTYKQKICFEFHKDKCAMLDSFAINDLVEIEFNLNGKEFNGKYYNTLQGWKITNTEINF